MMNHPFVVCSRLSAFLLAASVACSAPPEREAGPQAEPEPARHEVTLSVKPTVAKDRLTLQGSTNLPDGALISYEVNHEQFGEGHLPLLDSPRSTKEQRDAAWKESLAWMAEGQIPVKDGQFSTTLDVKGWPRGKIEVWTAFQTILGTKVEQPKEVIARYGKLGEHIGGAQATTTGSMRRVEAQATVVKP